MADIGEGNTEKLGYLGLGMMGFPMSRRLIKAGHDVTVWNRSAAKATALVEAGAKAAACPRDVAIRRRHHLHVPHRRRCRRSGGVRPRWPRGVRRLRQARRRLLVDPSGCGPRHRRAAQGRQRHGMDRRAGLRRHHGRGRRHACGHGRRRCRRHRTGAGPMCCRWRDGSRIWARPARARPQSSATR